MNAASQRQWSRLEIDVSDESAERKSNQQTLAEPLDQERLRREQGMWVPACGGGKQPFYTRTGDQVLYCWQPSTSRHAYLDCGADLIISDSELPAYGLGVSPGERKR